MKKYLLLNFILGLFFLSSAHSAPETPALCLALVTHYDEIVFNSSGDMDSVYFANKNPKKNTSESLKNIIVSDSQDLGRLQWTLKRIKSGNIALKGHTLSSDITKAFPQTLAYPDAYDKKDELLKKKASLKTVNEFREFKNKGLNLFEGEFKKYCGSDFVEITI